MPNDLTHSGVLRCYVCGKELGVKFSLLTMARDSTDRVFVAHDKCATQADDAHCIAVTVRRQKCAARKSQRTDSPSPTGGDGS